MSREFWYICFYVILFEVQTIFCSKKSNLVFVIDETQSMQYEIDQVADAIDAIIDIMDLTRASEILEILLVTFNDPENHLRLQSSSRHDIKNVLRSIEADGGYDCPEPSLNATKLGLEKSLKGSYVFVFTDDTPKDKELKDEVKRIAQEKQSQVVFVITPTSLAYCRKQNQSNFAPYYEIAAASSGQVFRLSAKGEIKMVLPYVEEIAKGPKTVITDKVLPADVVSTVEFKVDDKTDYAIVSASGQEITFELKSGPTTQYEKIVWRDNVKIVKVIDPGHYVAHVNGASDTSVIVYGRTDFTFQHGFSNVIPSVFNASKKQPTSGKMSHLLILVVDPEDSVQVESAQILDMDEKVIKELPLRKVSENYYATDKFSPPEAMFRITVKGKDDNSGKIFIRTSKTPVQPIPETPDSVNIMKVKEHDSVTITCSTANVTPEPTLAWKFLGRVVSTNATLHIEDVTLRHSGDYTCIAENESAHFKQIFKLEVEETQQKSSGNSSHGGAISNSLWTGTSSTNQNVTTEYGQIDDRKLHHPEDFGKSDNYYYLMSILPEIEKIPVTNKMRLRNKINQAIIDEMNVVCF